MGTEVTVGIDIGTSSVKAIAADGDGNVVARVARAARRARCPRPSASSTTPPRRGATALAARCAELAATSTCAACQRRGDGAVAHRGRRRRDAALARPPLRRRARPRRRRRGRRTGDGSGVPRLRAVDARDGARRRTGYWPAQAVANHALAGEAVLDTTTASTRVPAVRLHRVGRRGRRPSSGVTRRAAARASCRPAWEAGGSAATARRSRRAASTRSPNSSWPAPTSPATCWCCSARR